MISWFGIIDWKRETQNQFNRPPSAGGKFRTKRDSLGVYCVKEKKKTDSKWGSGRTEKKRRSERD